MATSNQYCFALVTLAALTLAPLAALSHSFCHAGEVATSILADTKREVPVLLNATDVTAFEFRTGPAGKIGFAFKSEDGKMQNLEGIVRPDSQTRTVEKDGKKTPEKVPMDDAFIEFKGAGLLFRYHSRPNLVRYTEAQQKDLAATWATLIAASQRFVALDIRSDEHGAELWLDGRYCGRIGSESRLSVMAVKLEAGGELRAIHTIPRQDFGSFLPLDVRAIARPGALKSATISLPPGLQKFNDVPMLVAAGNENADVGTAKEMQGMRFLETDEYTSRTSLDGMAESLHFSVPQEFYHRAWVLCAVEQDAKKDPVLTARLTRFGTSGRGGAIADTSITLPDTDRAKSVGNVTYNSADGKTITSPLYLVRFDLKAGEILDLLADRKDPFAPMKIGPYLDFEFTGKLDGLYVQSDRRHKPVRTSTSSVHIFGVTLEKSPVEMRIKQSQPGNIFHNDEPPETSFSLRANVPGTYTLSWEIRSVAGNVLHTNSKRVDLLQAGSEADVSIPLAMLELGWYGLRVSVADKSGAVCIQHDASFALLGKDTRTAGIESPFGTWWFGSAHYSERDLKIVGPMFLKAGLRRTPVGWTKDTEADMAPWKMSLNQLGWGFRTKDLDDWPAAEARVEKLTREKLAIFPHCRYVDIFHESFDNATVPPELYGEKPSSSTPEKEAAEKRLVEVGIRAAKFYRAKFPQLKLVYGNSGGSSTIIAMLLRHGFPRDLIDFLGSETTAQTIAPEKINLHTTGGIWMLRETAHAFGHDIPLTGCYEYTCRAERDLGPQRLAEWYTKDILIALAYRFETVSPAVIEDVGNAYYHTLWGASGLCERSPLHYPKPAYVAIATLTKALDSARLVRQVPTGSSSVYALEFERGTERIYALWTARGNCAMTLHLPGVEAVSQIGFYGRNLALKPTDGKLVVDASSAVTYVVSPKAATEISAGRRTFPNHQPPANAALVSPLDDIAQWQLAPNDSTLKTVTRRPGIFTFRQVSDPEKGACLELQLEHQVDVPKLFGEYTSIQLKQPVPVPGRPHTVGVWVKGDSSWGRVFFEFEDSKGERWRSSRGTADGDDWGHHSTLDFDGWCYITVALTDASPARHIEPTGGAAQWDHRGGDGKLDFPLKLVALHVVTHRHSVNLTEMEPVKSPIRLKDLSVFGE